MRKLIYAGILFLALLMQSTLLTHYRPFGVIPDLLMIVVIVGALLKGPIFGLQLGLVAGFLQDILMGSFGTNIVIKVFVGYLVGYLEGKVFKQQIVIPIISVFTMTFVHEVLFLLLSEQLIFSISPLWALRVVIIPLAVVNSIFTLLIYPALYFLERKIYYY